MSKVERVDLLERVKAATGPDRKLDAALYETLIGAIPELSGHVRGVLASGGHQYPDYTYSADTTLALVGRMLPGWKRSFFEKRGGGWISRVSSPGLDTYSSGEDTPYPTPALALLVALLTALAEPSP